jgi:hypothetical protein
MKKQIFFVAVVVLGLFFCRCNSCNRKEAVTPVINKSEVKQIQKSLNIHIWRYEQALNAIEKDSLAAGLKQLQKDYYFFIGDNPTKTENVAQIRDFLNDKNIKQLFSDVEKQYKDISDMEKAFTEAFSLLKYHFSQAVIPRVYTTVAGLFYEMPIIYYDTNLVISLDMYLGKNYKAYKQLGAEVPKFISRRYSKEYILPDCFKEISYQYIKHQKAESSLLDEMILEGKRLLFTESMLPNTPDSLIFAFPQEKIQWAMNNEANIWGYLIENNYLYSKDNTVIRKFIAEAPFTNFFGQQSPGKVGAWIGWQICRSWIQKNPDKKLSELMNETDAQKILSESKYKPKK